MADHHRFSLGGFSRQYRLMMIKDSHYCSRCRCLFFLPMILAFVSSGFLLCYLSTEIYASKVYINSSLTRVVHVSTSPLDDHFISLHPQETLKLAVDDDDDRSRATSNRSLVHQEQVINFMKKNGHTVNYIRIHEREEEADNDEIISISSSSSSIKSSTSTFPMASSTEDHHKSVYHDTTLFMQEYNNMKKTLKIYAYPHNKGHPFANVLLPEHHEIPGGNYSSESYFKKALFNSGFLTDDPSQADLFYLPFSIAGLRHDKRVGVGGIQSFVRDYVVNISQTYPFWNRSNRADHFYVSCHSVSRSAMEKVVEVKLNAIQLVCSSSYFLPGYVAHKDASIPQIWPRKGEPAIRLPSQRKTTAFYAGAMNSKVREFLVRTYKNNSEIKVHRSRLKTPYSEALLGSKFCIHAKGFEVNTARIGDALYYGCVPVILADFYDLPFADVLDWNSFSVVVSTTDIPKLKKILQDMITSDEYDELHSNVMRVRKHFQWHDLPVDYDAFFMVMYELWLRRDHLIIQF